MVTKALKDFQFCIENVLNNLDYILRKFNIKPDKTTEGVFAALRELVNIYKQYEKENRNLHRLVDKILDEFNTIITSVENLIKTFEKILRDRKYGELLENFKTLEVECAKNVRKLSSIDVLSLEIDECKEMQWWKETYNKIREVVHYLTWLTYYTLMLLLYLAYRHATDGAEAIQSLLITKTPVLMLIHRALMR